MRPPRRWTNQILFLVMGVAFTTGWVAFFYGTAPSRLALILHAATGYAIVALTPWKSVIAARAIRRRRVGWSASLLFSLLVTVSVIAGILHSTGVMIDIGPFSAMAVHVGAALAALPLAIWHVAARWVPVRSLDLSRRNFLRTGSLAVTGGLAYASSEAVTRLLRLPGTARRFTGSYAVGSLQPGGLPITNWLFDPVPVIDAAGWSLTVKAGVLRQWRYEELLAFDDRLRATLDCTGGFYSTQDWSGVWLSRLIPPGTYASSIHVRSATGYDRRFSVEEAGNLLLATHLGGMPLEPGHGFPVRLVAPSRRGYWWVKWVASITLDDLPDWWQLPFPAQ